MSVSDFLQIENQSEEKLDKVREPAHKFAHALLQVTHRARAGLFMGRLSSLRE